MVLNWPHLHLMLNHIPVLGTLFGLVLLVAGMLVNSDSVKRVALYTFIASAAMAGATFLTGEPAEMVVKGLATVSADMIEEHEEFAEAAMSGSVALGVISAGLLYYFRGKSPGGRPLVVTLLAAAAVTGMFAWTANLGGMVHHQELRPGFVAPSVMSDVDEG